uniref:DOMON domain-containing protein n=1 Tax=Panagrolaimus sp. JU765 TaxID=591449 RepID=A0AC34QK12_9BILA
MMIFLRLLALICGVAAVCRFNNGQYDLAWIVDRSNNVHFQLRYFNFPPVNAYTGIAFGQSMESGLDTILVKLINGKISVTDEYVQGFGPSFPDRSQDVTVQNAEYSQGTLKVRFTRPIRPTEPVVDYALSGCTPWQFITAPGAVHDYFGRVGKHSRRPITQIVCIDQCRV